MKLNLKIILSVLVLYPLTLQKLKAHVTLSHLLNEKTYPKEKPNTDKEIVRSLYENIFNKRQFELLSNIVSEEYSNAQGLKGVEGFKQQIISLIQAFPDAIWKVEDIVSEENKVIVIQKFQGTQLKKFQNFEASGKAVIVSGVGYYKLKDGKIISSNIYTDRLGFFQQLGVLPLNINSLPGK